MRNQILLSLLILMILVCSASLRAQLAVGVGLQAGFGNMPNANVPVDKYNALGFLYKRMNKFHWPFGEIYQASFALDRGIVMLNLNTRRQRATAKSTDAGGIHQRDVRFVMQALSLGGGYAVVDQETFAMYFGGALDFGYMRLLTRSAYTTQINRTDYQLLRRDPMIAGSIFVKMLFRSSREAITSWSLTPYLHVPMRDFDFIYMDQILWAGPQTPYPITPLPARPINVGISANFDFDLLRFLAD